MRMKSGAVLLGLGLAMAFATACNPPPREHSRLVDVGWTKFGTRIANIELYTGKRAHLNIEQVEDELSYLGSGKCMEEHERGKPAQQGWCAAEKIPFQLALDKLRP